jgi:hypothetical protein
MLVVEMQGGPTDVHLPLLPFEDMSVYLETNTMRLQYMQRLGCLALLPFLALSPRGVLDKVREEVLVCERRRNAGTLCMVKGILIQRGRLR